MTFLSRSSGSPPRAGEQTGALVRWRSAADLVWACWERLGEAGRDQRDGAFLAYLDALDAEAAAAEALACNDLQMTT